MNMPRPIYFPMLVLVLFLSGCIPPQTQKMYSGPQLEPAKESTITTNDLTGNPVPGLRISSVDGKKTVNIFIRWMTGSATEVKVTPGKHDIGLLFNTGTSLHRQDLWLVACPGKTYDAKARYDENETQMWIEDPESGNRVGGIKGSADEPKGKNVLCDPGQSKE
jgi:hypothetical protein